MSAFSDRLGTSASLSRVSFQKTSAVSAATWSLCGLHDFSSSLPPIVLLEALSDRQWTRVGYEIHGVVDPCAPSFRGSPNLPSKLSASLHPGAAGRSLYVRKETSIQRQRDLPNQAYVSGNSIIILDGPQSLLQTICQDEVETLDAIAIDSATGKIATSSAGTVFIYKPYGLEEGYLKWSQQCSFVAYEEKESSSPCCLSWGMPGELLVGCSSLRLYHTNGGERLLWKSSLPSDVQLASFSHDADLIASIGQYDSNCKVWRRLSSGPEDNTFDFSYLAHPAVVTDLFWRRPEKRHSSGGQHVLYTVCADRKLRIWASIDHHGLQHLQLWGEIDLQEVIQPRHLSPDSQSQNRLVFVIPGEDFDETTKAALENGADASKRPFLEHLGDIASQKPDVCVVLDGKGHMSAWGLQNIGSKRRKESDVFNIALVENFNLLRSTDDADFDHHLNIFGFRRQPNDPSFSVLVHYFDGTICWCDGRMDEYFDPAPNPSRLRQKALWTAHESPIEKLTRNASGLALISRSDQAEALIWQSRSKRDPASLHKTSSIRLDEQVLGLCVLDQGNHIVSLQEGKVCLWETDGPEAKQIACCAFDLDGNTATIIRIPASASASGSRFVAVIGSSFSGAIYEIKLTDSMSKSVKSNGTASCSIEPFCVFELPHGKEDFVVRAIDPVGYNSAVPQFLDAFAPDLALATTTSGVVETYAARLDIRNRTLSWVETAKLNTGISNPALSSGSSSRKVAMVDESGTGLSIWDTKNGDLEFEQVYGIGEEIRDLDWTATPGSQSLLAVGFPHKVVVFGQMRYNYLLPDPAWAAIREIYIRDLTPHPIGDSTWLGNGSLVIGVGNQLLIYDDAIHGQDRTVKDIPVATHVTAPGHLFGRVNLLNGPLPLFHPQFLTQAVLFGRVAQVQQIIVALHNTLKFWTEGDELDSNVGITIEELFQSNSSDTAQAQPSNLNGYAEKGDTDTVTEDLAVTLNEKLAKISLPYISSQEQFYLANLIESVALTEKQRRSVDTNAARFITFFRQYVLIKASQHQVRAGITWREYSWAFHSNSQDILVDLVSRQFQGKLLWEHARETGLFMWLTDASAIAAQFEIIARNEYTKMDDRNPVDCSLFYLALRKKNVLLGLWRMASGHKERNGTQKLLGNNFSEARWQTAALKNAYALLGRRRFQYAAAFFLLADRLQDAVNVCVNQISDLQLAIAIARVYGGDESPILRTLLEDHILPQSAQSGDRWQAMWAFWMLGKRDLAVRALITPIWNLIDSTLSPSQQARSFLSNDPALVVMYQQLREKTLQALKGATQISPREEWEFVLKTARLYVRMGCDHLALDLVRNWNFLRMLASQTPAATPDPRKLFRRRSSFMVDDVTSPASPTALKTGGKGSKPPPTMFEEPAASSLLDSFGF